MVKLAVMVTPSCMVATIVNTKIRMSIRLAVLLAIHFRAGTLSINPTNPSRVTIPKNTYVVKTNKPMIVAMMIMMFSDLIMLVSF